MSRANRKVASGAKGESSKETATNSSAPPKMTNASKNG